MASRLRAYSRKRTHSSKETHSRVDGVDNRLETWIRERDGPRARARERERERETGEACGAGSGSMGLTKGSAFLVSALRTPDAAGAVGAV